MKVCEIFSSMQGEGPFIGVPAVFIRTVGCVKPFCDFCDTKYSWSGGKEMSVEQILDEVNKYPQELVVISGGEPTLQHDVVELVNRLYDLGHSVQIETSGKVDFERFYNATVVCSPKQYNGIFVIKESAIQYSDYFKFVIKNEAELNNVLLFLKTNLVVELCQVYLMPEGASREEQIQNMPQVVEWCCKHGFKMSPRLHVLIWDKKRGV